MTFLFRLIAECLFEIFSVPRIATAFRVSIQYNFCSTVLVFWLCWLCWQIPILPEKQGETTKPQNCLKCPSPMIARNNGKKSRDVFLVIVSGTCPMRALGVLACLWRALGVFKAGVTSLYKRNAAHTPLTIRVVLSFSYRYMSYTLKSLNATAKLTNVKCFIPELNTLCLQSPVFEMSE